AVASDANASRLIAAATSEACATRFKRAAAPGTFGLLMTAPPGSEKTARTAKPPLGWYAARLTVSRNPRNAILPRPGRARTFNLLGNPLQQAPAGVAVAGDVLFEVVEAAEDVGDDRIRGRGVGGAEHLQEFAVFKADAVG